MPDGAIDTNTRSSASASRHPATCPCSRKHKRLRHCLANQASAARTQRGTDRQLPRPRRGYAPKGDCATFAHAIRRTANTAPKSIRAAV